jgi:Rps23 Pro-64 3,4-dihydroxylase Tpa1-like proline 4-hydroxylase
MAGGRMTEAITINSALDAGALGRAFADKGRIHIEDFLAPASADQLLAAIRRNQEWYLAYTENGEAVESPSADIQRLNPQQKQQFFARIHQRAADAFQYCFLQYYVTESVNRGDNPDHPLHVAHDFVNSEAFLGFMRSLTGEPGIRSADVLASCYGPGHYLTSHDDTHHARDRVAAYVISLTPDWNRNWGGHLAFFDKAGNIEEALIPCFNALNVFSVPQFHAVQMVAPFARSARTSLTGWVHR